MTPMNSGSLRRHLCEGQVIPAMPLALNEDRTWSPSHQRALLRYYMEAGAGGIAVGVHTTQFEIRDPKYGMFDTLLEFCAAEVRANTAPGKSFTMISGICGDTKQAVGEAERARQYGYDAGLLSLSALGLSSDQQLLDHCREVAAMLPVVGFYLQPIIGGRTYGYHFWRAFAEIDGVIAIKIAPFNRYATLEVVRAVAESGREDIALYTGNDDNIIHDLITPFPWGSPPKRIVGGLLGQWAVGTRKAVALLEEVKRGEKSATEWAALNACLTDFNSAIFDPANGFKGCISGINELLRRDGLLPSRHCLDPHEVLSPGQEAELERVTAAYPEWQDTAFIAGNLERWMKL